MCMNILSLKMSATNIRTSENVPHFKKASINRTIYPNIQGANTNNQSNEVCEYSEYNCVTKYIQTTNRFISRRQTFAEVLRTTTLMMNLHVKKSTKVMLQTLCFLWHTKNAFKRFCRRQQCHWKAVFRTIVDYAVSMDTSLQLYQTCARAGRCEIWRVCSIDMTKCQGYSSYCSLLEVYF